MRSITEIIDKCEKSGIEIVQTGVDGVACFNRKKKQTVICSWGGGWEHVSINGKFTPTWEEMCAYKEIFWHDDEVVVQYHPAKAHYVNNLEHCLHMWKPIEQFNGVLPVPDDILVGIKGLEFR